MIPIIRPCIPLTDVCAAVASLRGAGSAFEHRLQGMLGQRFVRTAGSGIAAFYAILRGLKMASDCDEVVLPAYTAGSLFVAVRAAGLKPVLCDVSLDDFNMDLRLLLSLVSAKTLAVVAVHLFGIPQNGINSLRAILPPHVVLIEDCCQAMGSTVGGKPVGSFSDISFFSFNRGKNTTLLGGGAAATNDRVLDGQVCAQLGQAPQTHWTAEARMFMQMALAPAATWPPLYAVTSRLAAGFRQTKPPEQIALSRLTLLQASFGLKACVDWPAQVAARMHNGVVLSGSLAKSDALQVPRLPQGVCPAFNRFPFLCPDKAAGEHVARQLWRAGIESSRMYLQPLQRMFGLGEQAGGLPCSQELADRLLTLPVYPGIGDDELYRMSEVIVRCFR